MAWLDRVVQMGKSQNQVGRHREVLVGKLPYPHIARGFEVCTTTIRRAMTELWMPRLIRSRPLSTKPWQMAK